MEKQSSITDWNFANVCTVTLADSALTAAPLHTAPAWSALVADDLVLEVLLAEQAAPEQEAEALFLKHNVNLITRQVLELLASDLSEDALCLHSWAMLLRGRGSRQGEDLLR